MTPTKNAIAKHSISATTSAEKHVSFGNISLTNLIKHVCNEGKQACLGFVILSLLFLIERRECVSTLELDSTMCWDPGGGPAAYILSNDCTYAVAIEPRVDNN